jgi:hypothetical protein
VYTLFKTCAKLFDNGTIMKILERDVEKYFCWAVETMGGKTWKFKSPAQRGVADRIVCLPDGSTWFVELKTKGGRLAPLQKLFAADMTALNQRHAVLWTYEQIDNWMKERQ